jgi:uncharacterized cupredoxin-like copper-binding protein
MKISPVRLLVLAAVSASFTLLWAIPAVAHPATKAAAAPVKVTAGKPTEFGFTVAPKAVKHGIVTFSITNKGILPHTFKVCSSPTKSDSAISCAGKGTPQIMPGKSITLTVTFAKAGKYEYLCTIPAHAQNGMKGLINVT